MISRYDVVYPPAKSMRANSTSSPHQHNQPHQAMLVLHEDGTMAEITEPYFSSSRCAYLKAYEDASTSSQNLTLIDMGGVFLILGLFVAVSIVLWMCRHSSPAKEMWEWSHTLRERREFEKVVPTVRYVHGRSFFRQTDFCLDFLLYSGIHG